MPNETESFDDSTESDSQQFASISVTLFFIVLFSFVPVLFLDLRSRKINRSRDAKRTKYLVIGVFFSNVALQASFIFLNTACFAFDCNILSPLSYLMRFPTKGINLIFLLHRAKLVQGMSPILSRIWFEKILPAVVILFILGVTIGTMREGIRFNMECSPYADADALGWCNWEGVDQDEGVWDSTRKLVWCLIAFDAVIVAFLLILFVVPLYRVYRQNLGQMNANQLLQRTKLWKLLKWSVLLTFINQVSTTAGAILYVVNQWPHPSLGWLTILIAVFDPSINVWTSWLMINRNRNYLASLCCCGSKTTSNIRNQMMSRGLTDPHSVNSVPKLTSQSTIGVSSVDITAVSQSMNEPVRLQSS